MSKFIVIGIHGLGGRAVWLNRISEEFDRYNKSQTEHEFILRCSDLRGFGEHGDGRIESFHDWLKAVQDDYEQARRDNPDAHIAIFGHSLGGLIASNLYRIHPGDTLILSVPGFKGAKSTFNPLFVASVLCTYFFAKNKLVTLPAPGVTRQGLIRGKNYIGDPTDEDKFKTTRVSANLLWQILELGKHSARNLSRLRDISVLMLQVKGDTVVDNATQDQMFDLISTKKEKIIIDSDLHDWPLYDLVEDTVQKIVTALV